MHCLGTSSNFDSSDPEWALNVTCGFSMFRIADRPDKGSARIKSFITNALPVVDSLTIQNSELKSFPNPVRDEMTLYVKSEQTADMALEIMDSYGGLMFKGGGYKTNELLKIGSTSWKTGVYIVRAFYNGKIEETKIVKLE